ncbi:MAG TPA: hydroxyacid dehydrogenase [Syntrophus sp. (in: bacteria)]|nr:hydroxyacid dehydrogenase [Syntrophus sp. (in: bacteria)]
MKKKILIVQAIHERGMQVFDESFDVRVASDPSVATVIKEIKGVEGVVVRMAPFTREIIEAADALKVIGRHGVGVDTIDLQAATEKGIVVTNTPNANATSVAEHTLTAIGALAKRVVVYDHAIRNRRWELRNSYGAIDLDGKTLGLVGVGRIGSMVARRAAAAYNMKAIAFDPYVTPEKAREMGVTLCSAMDDVFEQADVVSLHTPLTPETRRLVNADRLRLMKPTAFLVNFSRGEVVDEKALYDALKTGVIAGAAIDVYDPEPPLDDNPLFELDNILLSPHSAALTGECVIRMATGAAEGVVDVLTGRRPQFVVNPEVLNK